ncbi:DUF5709 domain-containing protein [Streptomyces sp. NPDC051211]|uniref:DUF5709 domain-containing protein n=1 Tax=Streptomyces sp. NPDC051211 TaxID=3154643 RepID=UPI00344FF0E4
MSTSEARGNDVYQPQEEAEPAESQPDMQNALGEPGLDETMDTGYSPPDRPLAATRYGTTAGEQHAGETLDQRLAQEEPEPDPDAPRDVEAGPASDLDDLPEDTDGEDITRDPEGDSPTAGRARAGRLTATDEEAPVRHISVLAHDTGIDGGAASAEEAAVHVMDEDQTES